MDNVKLHRLPVWVLSLLVTTVLALGLTTTACSDDDKGEDGIVPKLVLTIPIDDGSMDSSTVAPETVKFYQISGYDKEGQNTYYEQFPRNDQNTNDEFTSLTLRKGRNNKGETTGVTYGTKSILINYLDADKAFLGYTLFTNLDLTSDSYKEIIVDRVILTNVAKKNDAIKLSLSSNVSEESTTAKGGFMADEDAATDGEESDENVYTCTACVDKTLQIKAILNVKPDPVNSDESVALDASESSMISYEITNDEPTEEDSEDVLKAWTGHPGYYRCAATGNATVSVSYNSFAPAAATYEITVVDEDIVGTLRVTIEASFLAELAEVGEVSYATIEGMKDNYAIADGMFTVANAPSISGNPTVTFYDDSETELGNCTMPDVTFTKNGETLEITIPEE